MTKLTGQSGVCLGSQNAMTADKNSNDFSSYYYYSHHQFHFSLIKTSESNLDSLKFHSVFIQTEFRRSFNIKDGAIWIVHKALRRMYVHRHTCLRRLSVSVLC